MYPDIHGAHEKLNTLIDNLLDKISDDIKSTVDKVLDKDLSDLFQEVENVFYGGEGKCLKKGFISTIDKGSKYFFVNDHGEIIKDCYYDDEDRHEICIARANAYNCYQSSKLAVQEEEYLRAVRKFRYTARSLAGRLDPKMLIPHESADKITKHMTQRELDVLFGRV